MMTRHMTTNASEPFDIPRILELAKKASRSERTILSFRQYAAIVKHVRKCSPIDTDIMRVLGLLAYGWMPTILDYSDENNTRRAAEILNSAKTTGYPLRDDEIEILKSVTNNSYVGASKVLHFIRPDVYPIWDSQVAKGTGVSGSPNTLAKYKHYMMRVHASTDQQAMESAVKWCIQLHGYEITPVRAIEYRLLLNAPAKKDQTKGNHKVAA